MSVATPEVSASWSYPPFSQLQNNTDCNITTDYIADSVLLIAHGQYLTNRKLGDTGLLTDWLDSLVPTGYGGLPVTDPDGNYSSLNDALLHEELLLLWYYGVWLNDTALANLSETETTAYYEIENQTNNFAYSCINEATREKMICDKLDIQGDPDVSGRGMMLAYYILIGLTIVYFFTLIFDRTRLPKTKPTQIVRSNTFIERYGHRAITALRQTVSSFLVAALVFATAMLGATVARYYAYLRDRNDVDADDVSFYTWLGSAAMSSFCVFPCLVLQTVTDISLSRYSRLFLWCAVISLAAAVWALSIPSIDHFFELAQAYGRYETWYYSNTTYELSQQDWDLLTNNDTMYQTGIYRAMIWENHCDTSKLKDRLRILLTIGLCIQAPGFIYCLFASLAAIISHSHLPPLSWLWKHIEPFSEPIRRVNRIARPIIGFIYLVAALVFLESFIEYRNVAKRLAPSTDTDTDWSFGQILALAQWAPRNEHKQEHKTER
ncbi:hypothetical protein PFICI_10771 [Pestalotiopsis fici W106-1]|uniref:Uncharacterized protein n=1 Tax=Pestalotiopsis fici (strain W106-1 / CGMCC3.15140) TaxID=1229662 RepID=W3WUU0_PESFW|nr:uncharacterized protein PFICI_10771 [Pestalotiopsis fici W106-1]ETS76897.1 hypothetical protein PFICI_10771 [Pestalotiopsis fici W106-1]